MEQQGEIILYQPDEAVKLEVRLEDETVWLTQAQIAELFGTGRQAITKHLKNIFSSSELDENSVCSILELTASDGKVYKTKIYNLDAILSVGYLMLSKRRSGVSATIYTYKINAQLQLDLEKHNDQYPPIDIRTNKNSHDRFLIIDQTEVYHIGASLKDLGKKLFAFSKMSVNATILIKML